MRQATLRTMFAWAIYNPSMSFIGGVGFILVMGFGGKFVIDGQMTSGEITAFLLYLTLFYEPVGKLHQLNQMLQSGRAAGERVFEILDAVDELGLGDSKTYKVWRFVVRYIAPLGVIIIFLHAMGFFKLFS